eukprot:SAG11_NODE_11388_length_764_cov_0.718797_2_plen_24_part_01
MRALGAAIPGEESRSVRPDGLTVP